LSLYSGNNYKTLVASLNGHYRYEHYEDVDYPTVGDWVLLHPTEAVIEYRLERYNLVRRRAAGSCEMQAIAANIDLTIIVSGLDDEFNLHRIERFLVLAAQAHVTPMGVLTKLDLCPDAEERNNIAEHKKRREGRLFGRMVKEVKHIKDKQRNSK
jgi:ribosome biogenesis GTPase